MAARPNARSTSGAAVCGQGDRFGHAGLDALGADGRGFAQIQLGAVAQAQYELAPGGAGWPRGAR